MKIKCEVLEGMHLDPGYALLTVQNSLTCIEIFKLLDLHGNERLNDIQFNVFMKHSTDLMKSEVDIVFDVLDVDHSGEMEFEEFYLIFCILIAGKDAYEKEFFYRHSSSLFQLIDADASGSINMLEFGRLGILFNFNEDAIRNIFSQFDASGGKPLDLDEFRTIYPSCLNFYNSLFTIACIDEGRAMDARRKVKAFADYHTRLLDYLEPILRRFIRTEELPIPTEIELAVSNIRKPYISVRAEKKSNLTRILDLALIRDSCRFYMDKMESFIERNIKQSYSWTLCSHIIFCGCWCRYCWNIPKGMCACDRRRCNWCICGPEHITSRRYGSVTETMIAFKRHSSLIYGNKPGNIYLPGAKKRHKKACNIL